MQRADKKEIRDQTRKLIHNLVGPRALTPAATPMGSLFRFFSFLFLLLLPNLFELLGSEWVGKGILAREGRGSPRKLSAEIVLWLAKVFRMKSKQISLFERK